MVAAEFIRKSEVRVEKKASVVENPSAATKSSLKDLFFKTKMCSSVKNGKPCLDSEECRYAHSDAELRPLPDLSKTVLCKQMEKTGVCTFPHCTFAHSRLELRNSTVSQFKVKLCNFYPKGKCIDGENCRFAHSVNELGELVKVRNPASPKPGTNVDSQDKGRVSTTDGGDASLSPSAQTVASSASISTPLSPSSKPLIMSAFSTSSSLEKNPNTLSSTNQQHHFHTIHHHHNQYLINNPHIVGQSNFDPIPFTANMNAPSPAHSSSLTNPSLNAYSSSLPCDSFQRPHLSSSKDASLSINLPPHPLYPPHLQQHQPQHYRHVYCPPPPSSPLDLFNSSPTGVDPSTAFSHHARYSHGTNSNNNNNNNHANLNNDNMNRITNANSSLVPRSSEAYSVASTIMYNTHNHTATKDQNRHYLSNNNYFHNNNTNSNNQTSFLTSDGSSSSVLNPLQTGRRLSPLNSCPVKHTSGEHDINATANANGRLSLIASQVMPMPRGDLPVPYDASDANHPSSGGFEGRNFRGDEDDDEPIGERSHLVSQQHFQPQRQQLSISHSSNIMAATVGEEKLFLSNPNKSTVPPCGASAGFGASPSKHAAPPMGSGRKITAASQGIPFMIASSSAPQQAVVRNESPSMDAQFSQQNNSSQLHVTIMNDNMSNIYKNSNNPQQQSTSFQNYNQLMNQNLINPCSSSSVFSSFASPNIISSQNNTNVNSSTVSNRSMPTNNNINNAVYATIHGSLNHNMINTSLSTTHSLNLPQNHTYQSNNSINNSNNLKTYQSHQPYYVDGSPNMICSPHLPSSTSKGFVPPAPLFSSPSTAATQHVGRFN
eukprot:GDKJ01047295.1.p1 GENE.GDKJ01047295.1~~GDKJ01047295.1.p1  ORF type:complete len:828 (+),score=218.80 GDKJ01047295.1:52-2535(+)